MLVGEMIEQSGEASPTAIALKGLEKTYPNGLSALGGFDLDVRQGEILALLGQSGCGKSTALRIVAGLDEPTRGTVEWPQSDKSIDPNDIGFVFQDPNLMPWSTVFGNVWLPLRLKGLSRKTAQDQVMNALEMVGLKDFAKSLPSQLSGGMKMRVSIARALVTRPKVVLMDEPFAALDEITRFKLNNDLLELWDRHKWTVLFVTHSVFEAVYLSSRVVVMAARPGRVMADIKIDEPYPRENFRKTDAYRLHCNNVSDALQGQ